MDRKPAVVLAWEGPRTKDELERYERMHVLLAVLFGIVAASYLVAVLLDPAAAWRVVSAWVLVALAIINAFYVRGLVRRARQAVDLLNSAQ